MALIGEDTFGISPPMLVSSNADSSRRRKFKLGGIYWKNLVCACNYEEILGEVF